MFSIRTHTRGYKTDIYFAFKRVKQNDHIRIPNVTVLRWRSLKEDGTKMWFRVKFKQVVKIKKISFTNRVDAQHGQNYEYLTVI